VGQEIQSSLCDGLEAEARRQQPASLHSEPGTGFVGGGGEGEMWGLEMEQASPITREFHFHISFQLAFYLPPLSSSFMRPQMNWEWVHHPPLSPKGTQRKGGKGGK
jgi:hypothetical protein